MMRSRIEPLRACVVGLACLFSLLWSVAHADIRTRVDNWQEDLDVYAAELAARHIDLFHTMPREDFERDLKVLRSNLGELSDPQIVAALMRLTHAIDDGHTSIPLWGSGYLRFPIEVRWVGDEAVIVATTQDKSNLLGARITQWNGQEMNVVYERLAPYVPFVENPHSEAVRVGMYLNMAELGQAIGLSPAPLDTTLEVEIEGVAQSITLSAVTPQVFRDTVDQRISYRRDLSLESGLIEAPGLRFAVIGDGSLGYIQFDRYPEAGEMDTFAEAASQALVTQGVRNLAIDFRENFGGDFYTGLRLSASLNLIDSLDWKNGIYVLTSGRTFSAAMSNSAQYADLLNARQIGEPTGASPCGYQDMGQFNLPNSDLLVTYSKRRFCFSDPVDGALQPDVEIAIKADDFRSSRDRALDWILRDIATRAN
jgi:hypothetical protein